VYLVFLRMPQTLRGEIVSRKQEKRPYTEAELWTYYEQLLDVFSYLQHKYIAHRDIKPDNILLDSQGHIQICDFGFAKFINLILPQMHTIKCTLPYAAPAVKLAYYSTIGEEQQPVEHDPFKSDVFSLGMTLLNLSMLDLPEQFLNDLPTQPEINSEIERLTSYSDNWRTLLRDMLERNEHYRPDFKKLKEPLPYMNIPAIPPAVSAVRTQNTLQMTVKSGLQYVRVSGTRADEVPCMISIKAMDLLSPRTQGVDVVCVIDRSGSMEGEVIRLVKMTLTGMVDLLSPQDCLSLVCFNDAAELKCPLVSCSEEGKRTLKRIINSVICENWTDIAKGFLMGLSVLQERSDLSRSAGLFLFSDGLNNKGGDPTTTCLPALQQCTLEKLMVCSFGYGQKLDTGLLSDLADLGKGYFQHVTSPNEIQHVFGYAIGTITTVVARNLIVNIEDVPCSVAWDVKCKYIKKGADQYSIPTISQGEQKDLIFLLKPHYGDLAQCIACIPLCVHLSYNEEDGTKSCNKVPLSILLERFDNRPEGQKDMSVYRHWCRVQGSECLRVANLHGQQGNIEMARDKLIAGIKTLKANECKDSKVVQPVLRDLETALARITPNTVWDSGMCAHFISISYCHLSQSASAGAPQYSSSQQRKCVNQIAQSIESSLASSTHASQRHTQPSSPNSPAPPAKREPSGCHLS